MIVVETITINSMLNISSRSLSIHKFIESDQIFSAIFLGAVIIFVIYSLLLLNAIQDKKHLSFLIFISSFGLAIWILVRFVFRYFSPDLIWWSNASLPFFIFFVLAASVQFYRLIFETDNLIPFSRKIFRYEKNLFILGMLSPLIIDHNFCLKLSAYSAILLILSVGITTALNFNQNNLKNRFHVIGFGLIIAGLIIFILNSLGVLLDNNLTLWSIQTGFFFLILFSSLSILKNLLKISKDKSLLEEKLEETLKQSDKNLRANVEERTEEINKINIMLMDRAIELGSINQITEKVNSSLNLDDVIKSACKELVKIFPVKNASIALLNDDKEKLIIVAFHSSDPEEKDAVGTEIILNENDYFKKAIESKKPLLLENLDKNTNSQKMQTTVLLSGNNNILIVPIILQTKALGIIILPAIESNYNFNKDEINLAKAVASKVANSVGNANLYSKIEKALDVAESDLEIGKEIQAGFFPEVIHDIKGWEIYAFFKPARQVAGDFYDVFQIDNSKYTAFVIADVCDKGVGAALFMVLFRSLLRAYSSNSGEIKDVKLFLQTIILRTNNYIAETHQNSNMFASIFFGILDPNNHEIYYINAGLDSPFILNNEGKIINRLIASGPVVGMFPNMDFKVKSVKLNEGDILFCFTDGTTDAKNSKQELFSEESLIKIITAEWASGFSMMFNLNSAIKKYIGLQDQYDDITQLSLRRKYSSEENKHSIIRKAAIDNLEDLRDFTELSVLHCGLNKDIAFDFKLAAEEICTNIINYGYEGQTTGIIQIEFNLEKDKAVLKISDYGKHFSLEEIEMPDVNANLDDRKIGGLGLFLVKNLMDKIDYSISADNRNQIILEKIVNLNQ